VKRPLALVLPLVVVAVLLGLWELYVELGGADPLVLPPPHAVASSLWNDRSLLWSNLVVTGGEVVLGIAVAAVAGFLLAVAIHFSTTLRLALYPLLIGSQAIPVVLIAPLLVLWLGFTLPPKLIVIALVSFFPIVVTTLDGLSGVDPDLIKLMRTFDAPRRRIFRYVELPSALPGVITGCKIAAVFTPVAAVFAEWSGATSGLGNLFNQSEAQLLMPRAWATVVVLAAFAIGLFLLLTLVQRRAVPWAYQSTGDMPR
jgi:ABC-type nitrate/sulfonate/bicarbonate transport system permease component